MRFFRNIGSKIRNKATEFAVKAVTALNNIRGDANIGQAVSILIAVVVGALLLAGLYKLFKDTVLPTLTTKVTGMFNYTGTAA